MSISIMYIVCVGLRACASKCVSIVFWCVGEHVCVYVCAHCNSYRISVVSAI